MKRLISHTKWAIALLLIPAVGTAIACTNQPAEPGIPTPEPTPQPIDAPLLPPLSEAVLNQRQAEMQQWIQSDLDLVGLGKIGGMGSPISPELEAYRQTWAETDPAVAPFLGTWAKEWNMLPHNFMTVFPSEVAGRVCLVRYRQQETDTVPFETYNTPLEFSVAQVVDGQLLASNTQSARSLIQRTPASDYVPYDVEFLSTVDPDGSLRVYASQRPPAVDPAWEPELVEQFRANQCRS